VNTATSPILPEVRNDGLPKNTKEATCVRLFPVMREPAFRFAPAAVDGDLCAVMRTHPAMRGTPTVPAISSGCPIRFIGTMEIKPLSISSIVLWRARAGKSGGVSIGPGLTAFTRMPPFHQFGRDRSGERTQRSFVAAYAVPFGTPISPLPKYSQ